MICILNFNNSRDLADLVYAFDNDGKTNLDLLLEDFISGSTNWSVPKSASPNDIAVFMCAATARANLGMATSHIPSYLGKEFREFVEKEKVLYKQYSGYILGYGIISTLPEYDDDSRRYYSDINSLCKFTNPIHISEFRSFITISSTNSITYLKDEQWDRLKWTINQKNPGTFSDVKAPFVETLEQEFSDKVKKEASKSLEQLEKEASKKSTKASVSTVRTRVYHRDPTIAALVKKRANGYCQLCGDKAPFTDEDGVPYLECHHITWLSKGGMDSADNCVALCPNCHKRMHIVNDPEDINKLKKKIKQYEE